MVRNISELAHMLHDRGCSCVISNAGRLVTCHERGVKDLLNILQTTPELLRGAAVADKVVGKGAAALMILGGVSSVYTDVISRPALMLLASVSVPVVYEKCVTNITNRSGTGICPVEQLCRDCHTAADCLPLIEEFVSGMANDGSSISRVHR